MDHKQHEYPEDEIRAAIGTASTADFDTWKQKNSDVLNSLTSVNRSAKSDPSGLPGAQPTRNQFGRWPSLAALATAILVAATCWTLWPRGHAFAETIEAVNVAKTISWVRTTYERITSKDGKRNWLEEKKSQVTYMAPGYRRYDNFDKDGKRVSSYIAVSYTHLTLPTICSV